MPAERGQGMAPARERAYGRCLAVVWYRPGTRGTVYRRRRCQLPAPKGFGTCHVHRDQEEYL